ncbi:hypothetical protein TRL7639_00508 [Falsiruegeria litorea R37]|uniref:50S ribosomal protein L35 n=1 Tax=Falsiruegeria litorea R37 TaxID=1200284 RepID=A0A1Y5RNI2_9RHOB|nr:hypothetical protein [Falsiruegeria litorea]SLN20495.1 hypothetical protein TRL7639_00508 [Falsiruegeria litorea R37]
MDTDLMLVLGMVVAVLSIPSMISAYSDDRPIRASAIVLLMSLGAVVYAIFSHPGGYTFEQIPEVFFGVVARFLP